MTFPGGGGFGISALSHQELQQVVEQPDPVETDLRISDPDKTILSDRPCAGFRHEDA
jgi:hypothetical protein